MDFENRKRYFVFFCVIGSLGLVYLYRDFIFSNRLFNSYDMVNAGIFFRSYLVHHIREFGSVPLWNPYIFCGLPYIGPIHGDIFYPLSFLKFLLPIHRAVGWTFILHIFLAGVFAYWAGREFKFSKITSGLVGSAYMFSAWLNSLVKPGHDSKFYVTALVPLLFLFLHRGVRTRPVLNYTIVGLVQGFIVLSPHPQMTYFCFWALAGFAVFNILTNLPSERKWRFMALHTGLTTYAVVLAMMIGAIQFLPTFEYTRNYSPRTMFQNNYNFAISWSMHGEEAFSQLVPEFSGANLNIAGTEYWGHNYFKDNSETAGLVILLMAIVGIIYYKRRDKYFFAAMAAVSLIYALGDTTPIFHYLYDYVPFVKMTRAPSMIMFLFTFAVCMLGGMGAEWLQNRNGDSGSGRDVLLKLMALVFPLIFLIGWYLFARAGEASLRLYAALFFPGLVDDERLWTAALNNLPAIVAGMRASFIVATLFSIIVLLARRWRLGGIAVILLTLLVIVNGIRFNQRFVQTVELSQEFASSPTIEYLDNHLEYDRVLGYGLDELRLQLYYHGFSSPRGYHGNELVWYYNLLNWGPGVTDNSINPRFADLTSVKYFLTPSGLDLAPYGYDENDIARRASFDGIDIVENLGCYPRVYLVGRYRVIADQDSINRLIYTGEDDLRRITYLEQEPTLPIDSISAPDDSAEIIYYSPDMVTILTVSKSSKILTISDNYFKDWHVYIDDKEAEPLMTYGSFRGVVVGPGHHTVIWKYIDSGYRTGRMITWMAVIWIVLFSIIYYFYDKRKKFSGRRL